MNHQGILSRALSIFKRRSETKSFFDTIESEFRQFGIPLRNLSSVPLSPIDAISITAVWSACRVIADGIAQVPWKLFRDTGRGREPARDHPLYDLMVCAPSSLQTSFQLRETIIFHAALTGDAVCFVDRIGNGRKIREIIPIPPNRRRLKVKGGEKIWTFFDDAGVGRTIPNELIWQVSGPSWDAVRGLNVIGLAQSAFGLASATEKNHIDFFENGAKVSGVYSVQDPLSVEKHAQLVAWIKEKFATRDAFEPLILDRGAKWQTTQMTGVDSQYIETRKHQIEEIARAFRVFPLMIGQADKAATYASAEQMFIAHVVHTLAPWYSRIELAGDKALLTAEERAEGLYTKFLPNGLMRGAARDRAQFYSRALGAGGSPAWMTQNEVREAEEMNMVDGADELAGPSIPPGTREPDDEEEDDDE